MSRIRYKPRLKRGVLRGQKFLLTTKDFGRLRKSKWRASLRTEQENFIRNDLLFVSNLAQDQKKSFKASVFNNQKFFAFFSSFKKRDLIVLLSKYIKKKISISQQERFSSFTYFRLDSMLFNVNFAKTIFQSRWLVAKGFIYVNGKTICSPSYRLNSGDLVKVTFYNKQKDCSFFHNETFSFYGLGVEVCYESLSFVVLEKQAINFKDAPYPFFFDLEELKNFNRNLLN